MISSFENGEVVVATHNADTVYDTATMHSELGSKMKISYAQLLGLADHLTYQIKKDGFTVYKYLPWATTKVMVAYMIRRAIELSQMRYPLDTQYQLLKHELKSRFKEWSWTIYLSIKKRKYTPWQVGRLPFCQFHYQILFSCFLEWQLISSRCFSLFPWLASASARILWTRQLISDSALIGIFPTWWFSSDDYTRWLLLKRKGNFASDTCKDFLLPFHRFREGHQFLDDWYPYLPSFDSSSQQYRCWWSYNFEIYPFFLRTIVEFSRVIF